VIAENFGKNFLWLCISAA